MRYFKLLDHGKDSQIYQFKIYVKVLWNLCNLDLKYAQSYDRKLECMRKINSTPFLQHTPIGEYA